MAGGRVVALLWPQTFLACCLALLWVGPAVQALTEAEQLLAFKLNCQGTADLSSWVAGTDPCTGWLGVICIDGSVAELSLPAVGLAGVLVPNLGGLSNLRVLDLGLNRLTGAIPPSLGSTRLQRLRLNNNALSGAMPAELGALSSLQELILSENQFNGAIPDSFGQLSKLVTLDVHHNLLTGFIPPSFVSLSKLEYLNLHSNQITGSLPAGLASLSSLQVLDLGSNSLIGNVPVVFDNAPQLSFLDLSSNWVSGSIPADIVVKPGYTFSNNPYLCVATSSGCNPVPSPSTVPTTPPVPTLVAVPGLPASGPVAAPATAPANASDAPTPASVNAPASAESPVNGSAPSPALLPAPGSAPASAGAPAGLPGAGVVAGGVTGPGGESSDAGGSQNAANQTSAVSKSDSGSRTGLIVGLTVGFTMLLGLLALLAVLVRQSGTKQGADASPGLFGLCCWGAAAAAAGKQVGRTSGARRAQVFTLSALSAATEGFDGANELGAGDAAIVYKGVLPDGLHVAVRRAHSTINVQQTDEDFQTEVAMLCRLARPCLLPLVGYCREDRSRIIVYEYTGNCTLRDYLYPERRYSSPVLIWETRLEIAVRTARALFCMHSQDPPIVHGDLTSRSIVLDDQQPQRAMLADFGLYKIFKAAGRSSQLSEARAERGDAEGGLFEVDSPSSSTGLTAYEPGFGFALEFFDHSPLGTDQPEHVSVAGDVYSFGQILLEIITGRPAFDPSLPSEQMLVTWVRPLLREGNFDKVVDPQIQVDASIDSLQTVADIALDCVEPEEMDRPPMNEILEDLEMLLEELRTGGNPVLTSSREGLFPPRRRTSDRGAESDSPV